MKRHLPFVILPLALMPVAQNECQPCEDLDQDGYCANVDDCDDGNPDINPSAAEVGDGVDNDCDGLIDEGLPPYDRDLDGFTVAGGDCDDLDAAVYPGADERFNEKDDDCDGVVATRFQLNPARNLNVIGEAPYENLGWSVDGGSPPPGYVSLNGDEYADIIAGAPGWGGAAGYGAAKILLGGHTPGLTPIVLSETQAVARAGWSVAMVGDFNLDLFLDVAIGAPEYDTKQMNSGQSYFVRGQTELASGPLEQLAEVRVPGLFEDQELGYAVAGGSINGDSFDDILVGNPFRESSGVVFLIPGGPVLEGTLLPNAYTIIEPYSEPHDGMRFGQAVAYTGDMNGDGTGDIIASASAEEQSGIVFWIAGSGEFQPNAAFPSLEDLHAASFFGGVAGENAGWSLAGNGDVNGDGAQDFLAADEANFDLTDPVAFLYLGGSGFPPNGSGGPLADTANHVFLASSLGVCPCSVSIDGDMNADGFDDILIGTAGNARAYLFLGRPELPHTMYLEQGADYVFEGSDIGDATGYAVSWAGSINGDAFDDFVIGAPLLDSPSDPNLRDAGAVFILLGFDPGNL